MSTTPIALFASGRGTNFSAIAAAIRRGELNASIAAVVSDNPQAAVLAKAKELGLECGVFPLAKPTTLRTRETQEEEVLKFISARGVHFIVLSGYMRILSPRLIQAFKSGRGYSRIVNIHPALLPAFPGKDSYKQAFDAGCKVTGVTVHLVDEGVDSGPICAQEAFSIEHCRSVEEVETLGLAVEHRLYTKTLGWILKEQFELSGRRVCVSSR